VWLKPLKFLGMTWFEDLGKIIWSSKTRSGRELEFSKHNLISLAMDRESNTYTPETIAEGVETIRKLKSAESTLYDTFNDWWAKESSSIFTVENILESLKKTLTIKHENKILQSNVEQRLATHGLFGFVQSRMYQGLWNYDLKQDFTMGEIKPNSWAWLQRIKNNRHNIYNSSTYAIDDLLRKLKGESPIIEGRRVLKRKPTAKIIHSFMDDHSIIWDTTRLPSKN
jgi:hypothetical protein